MIGGVRSRLSRHAVPNSSSSVLSAIAVPIASVSPSDSPVWFSVLRMYVRTAPPKDARGVPAYRSHSFRHAPIGHIARFSSHVASAYGGHAPRSSPPPCSLPSLPSNAPGNGPAARSAAHASISVNVFTSCSVASAAAASVAARIGHPACTNAARTGSVGDGAGTLVFAGTADSHVTSPKCRSRCSAAIACASSSRASGPACPASSSACASACVRCPTGDTSASVRTASSGRCCSVRTVDAASSAIISPIVGST